MKNLHVGLGGYEPRAEDLPDHGLTLHDTGELLKRAGIQAGFCVESEYKVGDAWKIDWVWLFDDKPVVAIEIEGSGSSAKKHRPRRIEVQTEQSSYLYLGAISGRSQPRA